MTVSPWKAHLGFRASAAAASLAASLAVLQTPAAGQSVLTARAPNTGPTNAAPSPYQQLRYEEDWSRLADPGERDDYADSLKHIPFRSRTGQYLSLGGDARLRAFAFAGPTSWAPGADGGDTYLWQRYLLHGDLHLGPAVRVFGELEHSEISGRRGGPAPSSGERDRLDLNQMFIDLRAPVGRTGVTLRIGRQELALGSERLVSPDEGGNNRRSFQGVRGSVEAGSGWRIDGVALQLVDRGFEHFDDGASRGRALAGLYAAGPLDALLPGAGLDVYWLHNRDRDREYDQGSGQERRHTLGARFWGRSGGWDWNVEGMGQVGSFARQSILAFGVSSEFGYRLESATFRPRLGLRLSWLSGDRNPASGNLQTFSPLYPRGDYFNDSTFIGGGNLIGVSPAASLVFSERVTVVAAANALWRASLRDGAYGGAGQLVVTGRESQDRYIGTALTLIGEYQLDRHILLQGIYENFRPGPFLKAARPAPSDEPIHRLAVLLKHRF